MQGQKHLSIQAPVRHVKTDIIAPVAMADRAILRNLCAFEDIAAVEAYPFGAFIA
jgi:hypothetical protein